MSTNLTDEEPIALFITPDILPPVEPIEGTSTWASLASIGLSMASSRSSILSAPHEETPLLNAPVSRRHPIRPTNRAVTMAPSTSVPAERQTQRRGEKRKRVEGSTAEVVQCQNPCEVDPLVQRASNLRTVFSKLPIPAPRFVVGNINGDKVENFSVLLKK